MNEADLPYVVFWGWGLVLMLFIIVADAQYGRVFVIRWYRFVCVPKRIVFVGG